MSGKERKDTSENDHSLGSNNPSSTTQPPVSKLPTSPQPATNQPPKKTTLNHHPQILDEDTERFKVRLEDLVNKFKLETLTEFMTAKRNLLDEQANAIMNEKMVCETKYQSKCFEVSVESHSFKRPRRRWPESLSRTKSSSLSTIICPELSGKQPGSRRK